MALRLCSALGDYRDDIGWTRLAAELGTAIPDGTGVSVSQVEVHEPSGYYLPDPLDFEFMGKSFVNVSGTATGVSAHATAVGRLFYGTVDSIARGISQIASYHAPDWTGADLLRQGTLLPPAIETNAVENHSWIVDSGAVTDITRRLDFAIDRDGFTAVVGLNNSRATPIPLLLAHNYNAITVGRTDGDHSRGTTTFDAPGRTKPDLVVPVGFTSFAVPLVSGAAALLIQTATTNTALADARKPQCIKALLLAGATKNEFPGWNRTSDRPLDSVYGAGELNIYDSYHVLTSGQQAPSATGLVACSGWDFRSLMVGDRSTYHLAVPESNVLTRLSVVLSWHRTVSGWLPGVSSVPYLGLRLCKANGFVTGDQLDASTGTLDNVQHIYQRHLPAGQYAIEVVASNAADCALAWCGAVARVPGIAAVTKTDGSFGFRIDVTPGVPYSVEATSNLTGAVNWTPLMTNTTATDVWDFVDAAATNLPQRFYRVIPDP
jgi:hypothetical protein